MADQPGVECTSMSVRQRTSENRPRTCSIVTPTARDLIDDLAQVRCPLGCEQPARFRGRHNRRLRFECGGCHLVFEITPKLPVRPAGGPASAPPTAPPRGPRCSRRVAGRTIAFAGLRNDGTRAGLLPTFGAKMAGGHGRHTRQRQRPRITFANGTGTGGRATASRAGWAI